MGKLCASIALAVVLAALFFGGMAIAAPGLSMIGFCGWSPAMMFVGYALARAGIRISVGTASNGVKPLSSRTAMKATQP